MTIPSNFDLIAWRREVPRESLSGPFVLHDDDEEVVLCEYDPNDLNSFRIKKEHPLNKHYPHYCCKKMGGCGKRLWFDELVLANQGKLYTQFENKIWLKTRDQYLELGFESLDRDLLENLVIMRIHYKIYKYLRKLWKNKNIEFLCCSCYAKATQPKFKGKSILQDSVDALASWMSVIQYRMIVNQAFENFSERFGNITEINGGAPRGEPNDDD